MRLEELSLEFPKISTKRTYQLVDLTYMSPVGFYDKDYFDEGVFKKDGTIERIDVAKDGTAYKFYIGTSLSNFGQVELGIQEKGQSHKDYSANNFTIEIGSKY